MIRVVVTGIGAITPIGDSFEKSWKTAKAGLSGIGNTKHFDASGMRWKVAGELKEFDARKYLSEKEINNLDPFVHYAVAAAVMAVEDAGLIQRAEERKSRRTEVLKKTSELLSFRASELDSAGIIIGSSRGGITTIERSLAISYQQLAKRPSAYLMPFSTVSAAASYVAQRLGIKGCCLGISNACASGTNAIGEAYRLVKAGYRSLVLAGGADAPICRLCIEGYGVTGALSAINDSSACRPFDITRAGFVLSEGACILVIEEYGNAIKRGAGIYGEIIGYGNNTDAFHFTKPDPRGEARAISLALNEAGIKPEDIDYINAHATGTKLGDKAEAEAIRIIFGKRAGEIPVSSVKSMTGHMLSASGALEAAVTLMSVKEGIIIPTINLKQKDPECNLNIIAETRHAQIKTAITNSFGFGGVNAILTLRSIW